MEEKIVANATYIILIGSLTMLLLVGGLLFFFILYQKRLIKNMEEKAALKTDYQKKLLHSYIEAQEKERKRIAADLHDEIGSSLAAVKMMLSSIKSENKWNQELIDNSKEAIQKTTLSAREISHNLMPPALETIGLVKVLERMSKHLKSDQIEINLNASKTWRVSLNKELAIYRMAQELINNTLKHADANKIEIKLVAENNTYTFEYSDNGMGFKEDSINGLGLQNIRSRAQMIGAGITFFSEKGKASGVRIVFSGE